jgi:hypothetical protein
MDAMCEEGRETKEVKSRSAPQTENMDDFWELKLLK